MKFAWWLDAWAVGWLVWLRWLGAWTAPFILQFLFAELSPLDARLLRTVRFLLLQDVSSVSQYAHYIRFTLMLNI